MDFIILQWYFKLRQKTKIQCLCSLQVIHSFHRMKVKMLELICPLRLVLMLDDFTKKNSPNIVKIKYTFNGRMLDLLMQAGMAAV